MNTFWRLLKLPWLATVRSSMWWMNLFLGAVGVQLLGNDGGALHDVSWRRWGFVALAISVAVVWSFVANTLNLTRDARALGLPHARREAVWCLVFYSVLTVAVPVLILDLTLGHGLMLVTVLLLAASLGMAAYVLPTGWMIAVMVLAYATWLLDNAGRIHVPAPGEPGFVAWALPFAVVSAGVAIQRWRALQYVDVATLTRWSRPGVLNLRRIRLDRLHGDAFSSTTSARGRPDSHASPATGRLRRVGPDYPVRSIRAALHAQMKPRDLVDTGRRMFTVRHALAAAVVGIALLTLLAERIFGRALLVADTPVVLMAAGVALAAFAQSFWRVLDARWQGPHHDLALLALLPELGSAAQLRKTALRACLGRAMAWIPGLALVTAVAFLLLRVPAMCYLYLALMAGGGIMTAAALTTRTLGGKPTGQIASVAVLVTAYLLAGVTAFWGLQRIGGAHPSLAVPFMPATTCVALWAAWLTVLAALARSGWRAMQRRPHPFLPNPPA